MTPIWTKLGKTREQYIAENVARNTGATKPTNVVAPMVASLTPDTTPPLQGRNLTKEQEAMTKLGVSGTRATALMQNPLFAKQVYEMVYTPQELLNVKEYNDIKAQDDQRSQLQQKTQQMQMNSPNAMLALEDALRTKNDIGQQALGESELFKQAGLSRNVFNLQQSLSQNLNDMSQRYGSFTNALSRVSGAMTNQYQGLVSSYKNLTDEYQNQYAALNQTLDKIAQHDEAMSLAEKEAELQKNVEEFKSKLENDKNRFQPVADPVLGGMWTFDKVTGKYTKQGDNIQIGTGGESAVAPSGQIVSQVIGGNNVTADQAVISALAKADAEMFAETGKHIIVNSSNRTTEQQQSLYDAYQNGTGGRAVSPEDSMHTKGLGIDVTNWEEAKPYLNRNGIAGGGLIPGDANHFSLAGTEFGNTAASIAQAPSILGQSNIVASTGGQGVIPATQKTLTPADVHKLAVKAGYDPKKEAQVVDQFNRTGQIPDELVQVRQYGKILSAADKVQADAFSSINTKIKILEDNLKLVPGGNADDFMGAVKNTADMKWLELQARMFKYPPDVANYLSTRDGMSATFARAGGEKGALSEGDINRAVALLPEITDSLTLRNKKLSTLKKVMSAMNKDYTNSDTDVLTEIKSLLSIPLEDGNKVEYKGGGRPEAISILNSQGLPVTDENINMIINSK